MRILSRAATACFVICTFAQLAVAEDWPQFRGPTGQGISTATGLPTSWSTSKNVKWNVTIPGKGWSSPVIQQGRIYLTTATVPPGGTGKDRSLRTLCLDAKTGKTVWDVEVFAQKDATTNRFHRKNSYASPTPIVAGKHLFVHFGTRGTACLTTEGKPVWKSQAFKYDPRHGGGNSPVLVDDLLFINCDGYDVQYVVALDRKTGKTRWKKNRPAVANPRGFSFSTPLVIEVAGKTQIISPATDQVVAYEPKTGKEIWKFGYSGYSVIPRPILTGGALVLATSYNASQVLAIKPDGQGDVTKTHLKWTVRRGAPHTPSALAVGNEVYFVSDRGLASCVDAATGKLHWRHQLGGNFSASPVFADGRIYFLSEEGRTTVVKPGKTYRQIATSDLGEKTYASIAVADKALFVRTETRLYRIEKR